LNLFFVVLIMFAFSSLKTAEKVAILKDKIPYENVSFYYDGKLISTNKDTLMIGSTKDYIFLKDFSSNKNQIYNRTDVKLLKTEKMNPIQNSKDTNCFCW